MFYKQHTFVSELKSDGRIEEPSKVFVTGIRLPSDMASQNIYYMDRTSLYVVQKEAL